VNSGYPSGGGKENARSPLYSKEERYGSIPPQRKLGVKNPPTLPDRGKGRNPSMGDGGTVTERTFTITGEKERYLGEKRELNKGLFPHPILGGKRRRTLPPPSTRRRGKRGRVQSPRSHRKRGRKRRGICLSHPKKEKGKKKATPSK